MLRLPFFFFFFKLITNLMHHLASTLKLSTPTMSATSRCILGLAKYYIHTTLQMRMSTSTVVCVCVLHVVQKLCSLSFALMREVFTFYTAPCFLPFVLFYSAADSKSVRIFNLCGLLMLVAPAVVSIDFLFIVGRYCWSFPFKNVTQ